MGKPVPKESLPKTNGHPDSSQGEPLQNVTGFGSGSCALTRQGRIPMEAVRMTRALLEIIATAEAVE
jgi:hypothetical protein